MTQEEKELLLSDILGRLQYEVKAHYKYYDFLGETEQLVSEDDAVIIGINTTLGNPIQIDEYYVEVEYIKPYLRLMSSMSEEEEKEYCNFLDGEHSNPNDLVWLATNITEWLNKKMFDYRGLIPKGFALEAKEGMYKVK